MTETVPELHPHADKIRGLRSLSDWIEAHPTVPGVVWCMAGDAEFFSLCDDAEHMTRLAREIGGRWTKEVNDSQFILTAEIGGGAIVRLAAGRDAVCERVVVGTEEVEVPDPDAPTVIVTREIVEWRCPDSLLEVASGPVVDGMGKAA